MSLASIQAMRFRTIKRALVSAAAVFALGMAAPGCAGSGYGGAYVVASTPPAPRYIEAPYRPGYTYIQGRWDHRDRGWVWRDGYYVRERPGFVYIQGRWHNDGRNWRWYDGRWNRRTYISPDRRRRHVNDYYPR